MTARTRQGFYGGPRAPYGTFHPKAAAVPTAAVPDGGGRGAKARRKRRWTKRVLIDGKLYTVHSPLEERRLLEEYEARLRAELAAAPVEEKQAIRVKVKRIERRVEKARDRQAEWMDYLMSEDDEVLMLWAS